MVLIQSIFWRNCGLEISRKLYATFAFELFNLFYMGGRGLPRSPKRLARLLFEKSQCFRFEYPIDILVELCLRKIKKIVLKHLLKS